MGSWWPLKSNYFILVIIINFDLYFQYFFFYKILKIIRNSKKFFFFFGVRIRWSSLDKRGEMYYNNMVVA